MLSPFKRSVLLECAASIALVDHEYTNDIDEADEVKMHSMTVFQRPGPRKADRCTPSPKAAARPYRGPGSAGYSGIMSMAQEGQRQFSGWGGKLQCAGVDSIIKGLFYRLL
jgi:hypothetical protein